MSWVAAMIAAAAILHTLTSAIAEAPFMERGGGRRFRKIMAVSIHSL